MSKNAFSAATEAVVRAMKHPQLAAIVLASFALGNWGMVAAHAATNAAPRPQPARWLLVVDTSEKMSRRTAATVGALGDLLSAGMNGQLEAGDQIGIWTFDKELHAGVAPLQTWNPAESNKIAGRTAQFIYNYKHGGKSKLELAMPELLRVVAESRKLTVIIFSDGGSNIKGTPYDDAINAAYAASRPELEKTRMPLLTVLRSERGKFIGQNVSFAPWPVEFPPFTPEPAPPKPTAPATKPTEPRKSIIIGQEPKKTAPALTTNQIQIAPVPEVKPVTEIPAVVPPAPQPPTPAPPAPEPPPVAAPASTQAVASPVPVEPVAVAPVPAPSVEPTPIANEVVSSDGTTAPPVVAEGGGGMLSRKWMLILGIGCMWVAIAMALILVRRSRRATGASLITRSFDRDRR